jgi:hypothetical protein
VTDVNAQFGEIIEESDETGFDALINQARHELTRDGRDCRVDDIMALAWSRLPLVDQPEIMERFFITYWKEYEEYREEHQFEHAALNADASYLSDETLDRLGMCIACGPIAGTPYVDEVELRWIVDIVDEVKLLRRRLDMMRKLLITTERIENVPEDAG